MKTIFLILNWGFGGLLLLMGLWTISSTPFNMISVNLGGLCLLAIAFLLLPPVRKFLEGKTGKSLSIKSRAVTIFILLIVAVFGTHDIEEQIRSHEVAQTERDNIDYFKSNREEIVAAINESIDSGQFRDAINKASRYLVAEDEELNGLYAQANKRLTEEQERKEAQEKLEAAIEKKDYAGIRNFVGNTGVYAQLFKGIWTAQESCNKGIALLRNGSRAFMMLDGEKAFEEGSEYSVHDEDGLLVETSGETLFKYRVLSDNSLKQVYAKLKIGTEWKEHQDGKYGWAGKIWRRCVDGEFVDDPQVEEIVASGTRSDTEQSEYVVKDAMQYVLGKWWADGGCNMREQFTLENGLRLFAIDKIVKGAGEIRFNYEKIDQQSFRYKQVDYADKYVSSFVGKGTIVSEVEIVVRIEDPSWLSYQKQERMLANTWLQGKINYEHKKPVNRTYRMCDPSSNQLMSLEEILQVYAGSIESKDKEEE